MKGGMTIKKKGSDASLTEEICVLMMKGSNVKRSYLQN
jgi:hypothetical protein